MGSAWLEEFEGNPEGRRLLNQESLILEFTEFLTTEMERLGVSKASLARKLGKSRAHVSQILDGEANLTLRTIADVCLALGIELAVSSKVRATSGSGEPSPIDRSIDDGPGSEILDDPTRLDVG